MTNNKSNTKKRNFTHLSEIERDKIAANVDEGQTQIGRRMDRDKSTISREIKRGIVYQIATNRKSYTKFSPDVGARVYEENHKSCGNHYKVMEVGEFNALAEKKI